MKNRVFVFLLFIIFECHVYGYNSEILKLIKKIGSDEKNYTFFRITSGLITPQKHILAGDSGGHFISEYDWNGKFLRRVGRSGQGPMDFIYIKNLINKNSQVYVYDLRLGRITILNLDLKPVKFIKVQNILRANMFIDKNRIIGDLGGVFDKRGRIFISTLEGKKIRSFFNLDQFGKVKEQKQDNLKWALTLITSGLCSVIILITQNY